MVLDGHRSEGTIDMGYRPHLFTAKPDNEVAIAMAGDKCKDWGYESAKVLSVQIKHKNWSDNSGDGKDMVIQKYECVSTQGPPPLH